MHPKTRILAALVAATATAVGVLPGSAAPATAADVCDGLTAPVYDTVNPRTSAQLLTSWEGESINATSRYGFSEERGVLGYASTGKDSDAVAIYRMYNDKTVDFMWVTEDELTENEANGYTKMAVVNFYAAAEAGSCTVPIHRLTSGSHTRTASAAEVAPLEAGGWKDEGVVFHLARAATAARPTPTASPTPTTSVSPSAGAKPSTAPAPTTTATATQEADTTFGLAVIPDTQAETNNAANTPFLNRVKWLADQKTSLDLAYVLHTGDMTNWGWLDAGQLARARAAMDVLADAGLPFSVAVGNHDTAVVGWDGITGSSGYGGSAYMYNPECRVKLGVDQCKSWLLVRNTDAFNKTFPVSEIKNLGGTFESDRIDNNWTTFSRNDTKWLVLTLELDPRDEVVDWAEQVVKAHPDHNVILQTHHYLSGSGAISSSNDGYGANSGKYIYDRIVSKYSNVKLVFSGHTGGFTKRTDTNDGNTVVAFLGNDLGGPTNNPVRVLSVDTKTGRVVSTVYNPIKNDVVATTSDTISIIRG